MGVRVTREYNDGRKEQTDYVCFGFLANRDVKNSRVDKIHYHFNYEFQDRSWGSSAADGRFKTEMEELFSTAPMFRNFSFHARKGLITVSDVANMPTDELMTGLFTIRNMCMRPRTIKTYLWLRDHGFRPLVALCTCHLYERRDVLGTFDSENQRWYRVSQSEGSIFHQCTFGKEAFLRYIRQDYSKREFKPWKQDSFTEQRRYLRDSTIQELWGNWDHPLNSNGTPSTTGSGKSSQRRYMASALSIMTGKETPLHPNGVQHTCSDAGMVVFLNNFLPKKFKALELSGASSERVIPDTGLAVNVEVFMTEASTTRYSRATNPNNTTTRGTITKYVNARNIVVRWENGMVNTYNEQDLRRA